MYIIRMYIIGVGKIIYMHFEFSTIWQLGPKSKAIFIHKFWTFLGGLDFNGDLRWVVKLRRPSRFISWLHYIHKGCMHTDSNCQDSKTHQYINHTSNIPWPCNMSTNPRPIQSIISFCFVRMITQSYRVSGRKL